jgi:hypothetical protein
MNRKKSIVHFVISLALLFVGLFVFAINTENGDTNAASMYLVVFGFLPFVFWLSSYGIIRLSFKFIQNSKWEFISYILPSLIFLVVVFLIGEQYQGLIWVLIIISTLINTFFYFVEY